MRRVFKILAIVSGVVCGVLVVVFIGAGSGIIDAHWTWVSPGGDLYGVSLRGLNRLGVGVTISTIPQFGPGRGRWGVSEVSVRELINPEGKPYAFQGFPFFGGERFRPILPPMSGVPQANWTAVVIPYPYLIIATGYVPLVYGAVALRRRKVRRDRERRGLCVECGYDLRASKERCPECGREIGKGQGHGTGRAQ